MRILFTKLIVITALLGTLCSLSAATAVATHGKLTTSGGYILDQNNKIVQLRGMSMYWSTPSWLGASYYTAANVDALVDTYKCTVIRVAYDRNNGNDNGWSLCKTVIDECIAKGIYVIIDWHSHTAQNQESAAVTFFTQQAALYKNTPNVIFEPYNEPITSDGTTVGTLTVAQATWTVIKPYLQNVVNAIRGQGAENLIIAGTPFYSQFVQVAAGSPLTGTNIAYAFHFYSASHGPNAYYVVNGTAGTGGEESNYFDGAVGKIPLFVTEWGTTHSDGGQVSLGHTYIDETNTAWWMDKFNTTYHISHCNWSVSSSSAEVACAFSGSISTLSASGTIAMKYIRDAGTDTFDPPWLTGTTGPAGTTAVSVPGTIRASRYNSYYGAIMKAAYVGYANKDAVDKRTTLDTCLQVSTGGAGDEWVSYSVNASSATKYIWVRYLATDADQTIDVYIDNATTSAGTITLTKNTTWTTLRTAIAVSSGAHSIKFKLSTVAGSGYRLGWIEVSSNETPVLIDLQKKQTVSDFVFSSSKSGFTLALPPAHQFTSYSLISVDGRNVKSEKISGKTSQITCSNLTGGTWFVKFDGVNGSKVCKIAISK